MKPLLNFSAYYKFHILALYLVHFLQLYLPEMYLYQQHERALTGKFQRRKMFCPSVKRSASHYPYLSLFLSSLMNYRGYYDTDL
jgi:hypothetical protein